MAGKRKGIYLGVFTALSMILSYLETLVPLSIGVPGVKMGLPNLVTVFLLYRFSWKEAAGVSLVRVILTSFLFSNVVSFWYSLAGAALSIFLMTLLKRTDRFSPAGVSIAGGLSHNFAQIAVAAVLMKNGLIAGYLPVLCISGSISGMAIGLLSALLLSRVPK